MFWRLACLIALTAFIVLLKDKEDRKLVIKKPAFLQALIVVVMLIAIGVTERTTRLQLRPFIAVVKPSAALRLGSRNLYWLTINYELEDVGIQPAHECQIKNNKAIEISLPSNDGTASIITLVKARKWRNSIMKELSKYLENNPMADKVQIDTRFKGIAECFSDVEREFIPLPTSISPRHPKSFGSTRSGATNLAKVDGKVLFYYLYLTYEGSLGEKYSTSYVCYFDKNDPSHAKRIVEKDGSLGYPLFECRQWMDRNEWIVFKKLCRYPPSGIIPPSFFPKLWLQPHIWRIVAMLGRTIINWNCLLFFDLLLCMILAFIGIVDIKWKRKFPNGFIKSLCSVLTVFPPAIGFAIYYYRIMKPNRYAK